MDSLFDTHVHLTDQPFINILDQTVEKTSQNGVSRMLIPGYSKSSIPAMIHLKSKYPFFYTALGLHPMFNPEITDIVPFLKSYEAKLSFNAIGETGFDFRKGAPPQTHQETRFLGHLELAREHCLPLIIHCVQGHQICIRLLKKYFAGFDSCETFRPGIIHRATCSIEEAKEYLKMGFCFGVGPDCLDRRRQTLREFIQWLPLDHIAIETDAPYTKNRQGMMAEPSDLCEVIHELSILLNLSDSIIRRQVLENAIGILGDTP